MRFIFLVALTLFYSHVSAQNQAPKRTPIKFNIKSSSCRLEYKPMSQPKSKWQPYLKELAVGTTVQGFKSGTDVFTFRSANPKNLFFRGSLDCLQGKEVVVEEYIRPRRVSYDMPFFDDSGITLGLIYWKNQLVMTSEDSLFPDEIILTQNIGLNVGYSAQLYRKNRSSLGLQAFFSLALAKLKNQDPTPATTFEGTGFVGALQLRPYYYYQLGSMAIGPLLAFSGQYGIYGRTQDGKISKPLIYSLITGASLKVSKGGHSIDVGVLNFKSSKLYGALNFLF
jgi:hypothetical protein